MYYSEYDENNVSREEQQPQGIMVQEDLTAFYTQPAPKKRRRKLTWLKVTALILACAVVGGASGLGGALLVRQAAPAARPASAGGVTVVYEGDGQPTVVNVSKFTGAQLLTAAEVYASNVNSTVGISTQITTNAWGQQVSKAASGSGFVLTADGYIVTNHHVIEDATSISVSFKDGAEFDAELVGAEEENDIAVLKINAKSLTPVQLGSSDRLVVGEDVVAIGNPLGELTFSETKGIISAKDRVITISDGTAINTLQTDCAINSGNSGGPLFNMYGQVIGITNAKYSNNGYSDEASIEGLGFAIPIDDVKEMLYDIIEHGYVTGKPFVGVTVSTASASQAAKYGRSGGAYISSVVEGSAGDQAGLEVGDIITAVDGEEVLSFADFVEIKNRHKAGDTVTLTVDRDGELITLELTYGEKKPGDATGSVDAPSGDRRGDGKDYRDYIDGYDDHSDGYSDYFGGDDGYSYRFTIPFGFPFGW